MSRNAYIVKSHSEMKRLIVFTQFLLLIIIIIILFLFALILSTQVLSNHWTDCTEMQGYGRFGCEVVQQGFQNSNVELKGKPTGVPKTTQILSRLFLTNHSGDRSGFFVYDKY